ncbi:MAG: LysM peptidoglycan-binding domain-containing protein [Lachnospiraceae bacterium]|nr:LysM peptidoglycan-binding domain-containing protein [Lachnospiraceae bacterium]
MNRTERRRASYIREQKRRKARMTRIRTVISLCLLVLFFAGLSSMRVNAGSDLDAKVEEKSATKVYTSYTVCQGDTLYSIAKDNCDLKYYNDYEDYIIEIKDINHISSGKIYYGRSLTIPRYI